MRNPFNITQNEATYKLDANFLDFLTWFKIGPFLLAIALAIFDLLGATIVDH